MEKGWREEQKRLMRELIQGANLAKQLKSHLNSDAGNPEVLIQGILSSYEKALFILNWTPPHHHPAAVIPESVTPTPSPRTQHFFDKGGDGVVGEAKKRKMLATRGDQVRISSDTGLEGPHDDGYSWRKYGQKHILAAKHPRSYYRCTYRNTHNCWATKQVQRSDDDPSVFQVTYKGQHTCITGGGSSTPTPTSPHKPEPNQDPLTRFKTGLRVETDNLDSSVTGTPYPFSAPPSFGYLKCDFTNPNPNLSPSPFMSPSTPESNYFSHCPIDVDVFGQPYNPHHYDPDLTGIVSASTSATNSPIVDLDFQLEAVGINPNFPFDTTAFFP